MGRCQHLFRTLPEGLEDYIWVGAISITSNRDTTNDIQLNNEPLPSYDVHVYR